MEIKEHEQIKLNDFNAQLQVIRGNIRVANDELEGALAKKDEAVKQSTSLDAEIEEKKKELDSLNLEIESKRASIASREHAAELAEARLVKDREDFDSTVHLKLEEIRTRELEVDGKIVARKDEIANLDKKVDDLTAEISKLQSQAGNDKEVVKELTIIINQLNRDKASKEEELDSFRKHHFGEKKQLIAELEQLSRLVEEEREKVKLPRANLEREMAEFEVKKRDYQILVNRLRKYYSEIGVPLSI